MKRLSCIIAIIFLLCSCTPIGTPSETTIEPTVTVTTTATAATTAPGTTAPITTTVPESATTESVTTTTTPSETTTTTAPTTTAPSETSSVGSISTPKVIIQGEPVEPPISTDAATVVNPPATTPPVTTAPETLPPPNFTTPVTTVTLPPYLGQSSYNTLNYNIQKGFWISYLEYYSILQGKSQESFTKSINEIFDNTVNFGFNTVYVQVRAFGDAYYKSAYFPAGTQFSGIIGYEPGDVPFDALEIMVKAAHDRGLSFHAWVNPMRLCTTAQMKTLSDSVPYKAWYNDSTLRKNRMYEYNNYWYLTPSSIECVQLILSGVTEIIKNYDVDGIHIDDYFYPSGETYFDSALYEVSGSELSQAQWRVANINTLVRSMYSTIHSANNDVVFGIAPQAVIENNTYISADVRTWCKTAGYCDYIVPQVYYGFDNVAVPYADTIAMWSSMVTAPGVKLVIGLSAFKIGLYDQYGGSTGKYEWQNNTDIIARQMTLAETLENYGGVAIYRYGSLFDPESEVADEVYKEVENIRKLD